MAPVGIPVSNVVTIPATAYVYSDVSENNNQRIDVCGKVVVKAFIAAFSKSINKFSGFHVGAN